jgi:hypothetical protein
MAGTFNVKTGRWVQAGRGAPPSPKRSRPLTDDELLDAAVADGRILASRRAHYAAELKRRPKATRKLIASLAKGSPLTDAERERLAAYVGDPTDADGSWITPHKRTPPGTVFDVSGRVQARA